MALVYIVIQDPIFTILILRLAAVTENRGLFSNDTDPQAKLPGLSGCALRPPLPPRFAPTSLFRIVYFRLCGLSLFMVFCGPNVCLSVSEPLPN